VIKILTGFFITVCFVDLIILNINFFKNNQPSPVANVASVDTSLLPTLASKINLLEAEIARLSTITPAISPVAITSAPTTKNTTRHLNYLPIIGSLSQIAYDWVDVPGSQFYFDTADYSGLKEVRFEGNLKLVNGNGLAFARLYDTTNKTALINSQIQTSSQQEIVATSDSVRFLSGRNLIKVQIKSLTADTAVFTSGRLIITSEY